MLELLLVFVLGTTSPAPEPMRCAVADSTTGECVLWYDPNTGKFFDRYGNEQKPPW